MSATTTLNIRPRLSEERGNADHGWLKSFHTFDFASYQGSGHDKFGALRVINEDRVQPKTGFGTHSHQEFEIFSYIVSGELQHNDSLHNTEVLKRGDIQMTSTGTGISHSEHTHGSHPVHFLQIWAIPHTRRLKPNYFTRHFTDAEKTDQWLKVVAPVDSEGVISEREAKGPAPVHADLTMSATILSPAKSLGHTIKKGGKAYIHVIQTSGYNTQKSQGASVKISDGRGAEQILKEGDAAYLTVNGDEGSDLLVENIGDDKAEILLFDL